MGELEWTPLEQTSSPNVSRQFDEVPGEQQADDARDAFLSGHTHAPHVQRSLALPSTGLKTHLVSRLQRERGNAYVQRVLSSQNTPGRLVGLPQSEMVQEVSARKGSGNPLPSSSLQRMESFFDAALFGVRVHSDNSAAGLNRELNARAFTVGSDIFMGDGQASPGTPEGDGLLAHELTHVGQQGGFEAPTVQRQQLSLQREADEEPIAEASAASDSEPRQEQEEGS